MNALYHMSLRRSLLMLGLFLALHATTVPAQADSLYGGPTNGPPTDPQAPPPDCCDDGDEQDADCDPPSSNDGPDSGGGAPPPGCCCDMGMATWQVSEPYITTWIFDRPLAYKTSNGKWFPLKLVYKHRELVYASNSCGFGPKWGCNWLGMLQQYPTNS